jgi:hypothetical protein
MTKSVDTVIAAQEQKAQAMESVLQNANIPSKINDISNATERFNKLQAEAQRIIDATRTPIELYNKELIDKIKYFI